MSVAIDLRTEARHGRAVYTADVAARRLACLRRAGFTREQADHVFEAIEARIADLKALGFADPVKMITSSPAILGYARERLMRCAEIVVRLDDRRNGQLAQLIGKRRSVIEAVAERNCRTWREVRACMAEARA